MSRTLTSGMLAAIAAGEVRPIILVQATFASGAIYVWSGIGDLNWNGQTWKGLGQFGKITPINETTTGEARGMTLELSGVPADLVGDALNEINAQSPVVIYVGFMDTSGNVIVNPEQRWKGLMDATHIAEAGTTATLQINVESKLIDLGRARERHYTHADQQIDWPGDNGFVYVNGIQELDVIWGRPGTPISNLPVITPKTGSGGAPPQSHIPPIGPRGPRYL